MYNRPVFPNEYRMVSFATLFILIIGIVFYHKVEHFSWINALYFCVITLATVGYGDITPKTDIGKLFTVFYVITGIGILAAFINSLLKRAYSRREKKLQEMNKREKKGKARTS